MGGSLGVYGSIFKGTDSLARIPDLSREAKRKLAWVDYYRKTRNARQTCRHFAIAPSLFYKWYACWQRAGPRGLEEKTRRPHRLRPATIPWETVQLAIRLRKANPAWSKYKLAVILRRDHGVLLSASSCGRILKRYQLLWPRPMSRHRKVLRRINKERAPKQLRGAFPGSLVEVDTKHLCISRGLTFYQLTATDTCTKQQFLFLSSRKTAAAGKRFFAAMRSFYPFAVRAVQSDNGGEWLAEAYEYLSSQGIAAYFTHPETPQHNARVERAIQADEYEFWLWGNYGHTLAVLQEKAAVWMEKFNSYRPHQALGYLTPNEYYAKLVKDGKFLSNKVSTM